MNILPIQILISLLLLIFLFYIFRLRSDIFDRILSIIAIVIGIVFVFFPNLTTRIANLFGIGRGTDLLIYLFVLASLFYVASTAARFRQNKNQMTKIVREFAIKNPIKQIHNALPEEHKLSQDQHHSD